MSGFQSLVFISPTCQCRLVSRVCVARVITAVLVVGIIAVVILVLGLVGGCGSPRSYVLKLIVVQI